MPIKPAWLFTLRCRVERCNCPLDPYSPMFSLRLLYGHEPGADDQLLAMLDRDFAFCVLLFGIGYGMVASIRAEIMA